MVEKKASFSSPLISLLFLSISPRTGLTRRKEQNLIFLACFSCSASVSVSHFLCFFSFFFLHAGLCLLESSASSSYDSPPILRDLRPFTHHDGLQLLKRLEQKQALLDLQMEEDGKQQMEDKTKKHPIKEEKRRPKKEEKRQVQPAKPKISPAAAVAAEHEDIEVIDDDDDAAGFAHDNKDAQVRAQEMEKKRIDQRSHHRLRSKVDAAAAEDNDEVKFVDEVGTNDQESNEHQPQSDRLHHQRKRIIEDD